MNKDNALKVLVGVLTVAVIAVFVYMAQGMGGGDPSAVTAEDYKHSPQEMQKLKQEQSQNAPR